MKNEIFSRLFLKKSVFDKHDMAAEQNFGFRCEECRETYSSIFRVVDQGWRHGAREGICYDGIRFFKDQINEQRRISETSYSTPLKKLVAAWSSYESKWQGSILEMMKIMIVEYGADPYLKCPGGSAYECAVSRNIVEIVNLFEECTIEIKEPSED